MLEIVKALIEPVAKSISVDGLVEARKKRKAHEIGTELFLLYTSLNEILVVGRHIIDELNRAATWMKRKVEEGEPDREYHVPLEFWLRQQRVNILKLVASVKRLGLELQVISPETYVQLAPLIHGKFNAVNRLLQAISGTGRHTSMLVSTDAEKMLEVLRNAGLRS